MPFTRSLDSRSFLLARVYAIGLTILVTGIVTLGLACCCGADYATYLIKHSLSDPAVARCSRNCGAVCRVGFWQSDF